MSLDTTINHGPDQIVFSYIEGTVYYTFQKDSPHIDIFASNISNVKPENGNYLDLTSDSKKIMINMSTSIYHFFADFIGKILKQASFEKNLEVVINQSSLQNPMPGGKIYLEALNLLESLGIKVTVVDIANYDGFKIDKVYILPTYSVEQNYEEALYKAGLSVIKNKSVVPFRKVFLSRKHMGNRVHLKDYLTVKHDNRIDNHDEVEEYFKSLGYEIVVPEMFSSLEEQINFFYETKTLVSTTSSGLINAAFMQEGQTLIELQTPLIVYMPPQHQMGVPTNTPFTFAQMVAVEQLHFFYLKIAFHKKHKYIAINNASRKTADIKKTIEQDPLLKALLQGHEPAPEPEKKRKWLRR